jgi:ketol-acid reductoisomerase
METTGNTKIYHGIKTKVDPLKDSRVAVIGYGNQGRAQALNLRDSGYQVIIGNQRDESFDLAAADGFRTADISSAVLEAEIIMLLIPDEVMPTVFAHQIQPSLTPGSALVFASGYNIAYGQITSPPDVDVLLLAPRMIGVGVRERYLTKEGFFCFVGIHQDATGRAEDKLLALTLAVSGFYKPAIRVSFKQEAALDLFNEQAFGAAFGQVLLTSISVLLEHGLPPEAVLVEMYLSEEMAYTYRKMAQVGLVKQTLFHSQTSQYGAMSRGVRFMRLGLKQRMRKIFGEIHNGDFAKEWARPTTRLKLKAIRYFAMRQPINKIEQEVRRLLGLQEVDIYEAPGDINEILDEPKIKAELESFKELFEY